MSRLLLAAALVACSGCANKKLLQLENEQLLRDNADLSQQVDSCGRAGPSSDDFAATVDLDLLREYIRKAGLPPGEQTSPTAILVPIEASNAEFGIFFQLFDDQKVLYVATHNYLRIEEAASSKAMVLLLTKVATLNYDLLIGKIQLNPNSGAISLSAEIHLHDGLGFETFDKVVRKLIATADATYPELLRSAQGQGI